MAEAAPNADLPLKCIKEKKVPIGVTLVVAALLLAIIALAAKKCPSCPPCSSPSCLENWIGYKEKCFYFVEDQGDWNEAQKSCRSLGGHLATMGTHQELGFLTRYGASSQHWVGLRREDAGPWRWLNGSIFNDLFSIRGDGPCAYVDADGIGSDRCSRFKPSICSHPQTHLAGIQKLPKKATFTSNLFTALPQNHEFHLKSSQISGMFNRRRRWSWWNRPRGGHHDDLRAGEPPVRGRDGRVGSFSAWRRLQGDQEILEIHRTWIWMVLKVPSNPN
ncbi:C-type lectin domain family 2 member B-like [Phaenicophaeus curvirostris]|uniref:C-type lectin domain family 2 member B-like n=1 Tax=Phaenicophaeus curvirostris TaxID=33595 RepID=UPI0037F0E728